MENWFSQIGFYILVSECLGKYIVIYELYKFFCFSSSHHYSVPRIPAQSTSFRPTYVNVEIGVQSKQAIKKSLQQSKSAPQPVPDSPDSVSKSSFERGKCMTPPAQNISRRARPMSSYIPNGKFHLVVICSCSAFVTDDWLMLHHGCIMLTLTCYIISCIFMCLVKAF